MKKSNSNFKTKLLYGFLVVLPVSAVIVVIVMLVEVLEKVAKSIGLQSTLGAGLAIILVFFFLLAVCYGVGVLVHTQIGILSFEKFEKILLAQIPGYGIIKTILKGFTGEQVEAYRPAMIQLGLPGTAVLGFVMEENDNDTITVFVPSTPSVALGVLHIVEKTRVTFLGASHLEIVNCITEWGVGSNKVIGNTM